MMYRNKIVFHRPFSWAWISETRQMSCGLMLEKSATSRDFSPTFLWEVSEKLRKSPGSLGEVHVTELVHSYNHFFSWSCSWEILSVWPRCGITSVSRQQTEKTPQKGLRSKVKQSVYLLYCSIFCEIFETQSKPLIRITLRLFMQYLEAHQVSLMSPTPLTLLYS